MGSEANIRHKSTKLPVQLYRAFFKLCIAAAVYAAFCIFKGMTVKETSFAVAISILGAIAYEITYLVYKSRSKESRSKNENMTWKQVFMLARFSGYLLGIFLVVTSAQMARQGKHIGIALLILAFALCQQMFNNKHITSHLSTFCECAATGLAVVTLELIYSALALNRHIYLWLISALATVILYALSEFFFHFFNCKKHGQKAYKKANSGNKKALDMDAEVEILTPEQVKEIRKKEERELYMSFLPQKELILDRLAEFLRNALLVIAIWVVFALLIVSGSVDFAIKSGIYDKAIAIIPILISIASPVIDSQKKKDGVESEFDKYDPRIPPSEFKEIIINTFGENSISEKALDYVVRYMNKHRGYKRYNGEDYYVHPIAVAKLIMDHTAEGDEIVAAALLHDCIEDLKGCTYKKLEGEFGKTVADHVLVLSKKPDVNYRAPKNMFEYLDEILKLRGAAVIKTADRMNNMNTLENCTPEQKKRKFEQTRMYYPQFIAKAKAQDTDNMHFYEFAEKCFEEKKY